MEEKICLDAALKNSQNQNKQRKKFSFLFFLISFQLVLALSALPAFAAHTSNFVLLPEWSPSGQLVDYTVNVTNNGPDNIKEMRIFSNPNYDNFSCLDKAGWSKLFVHDYPDFDLGIVDLCWYYTDEANTIPASQSEIFGFSAVVPDTGCQLQWKFETRDETGGPQGAWFKRFVNTSVDIRPPVITKNINGPNKGPCPPGDGEECWVADHLTEIDITVKESPESICKPPSGVSHCEFSITLDGTPYSNWTVKAVDSEVHEKVIFEEDSVHELNIKCIDVAGNKAEDTEIFRVDSTPPETDKSFSGPLKIKDGVEWINTETKITLSSDDPDPTGFGCNIGVDKTWYLNVLSEDERACSDPKNFCKAVIPSPYEKSADEIEIAQIYCEDNWGIDNFTSFEECVEFHFHDNCCEENKNWHLYTEPFTKPEESCHILQYFSIDDLGNAENMQVNCFFVDDTPPVSVKKHGTPFLEDTGFDWLTQNTQITLDCNDNEGPHPVAQETLCYKVSLNDTTPMDLTAAYCSEFGGAMDNENYCCIYVGDDNGNKKLTLNFMEDSNHNLEYYCKDHLGNDERDLNDGKPNMQRYKVDTVAPDITKTMFGSYLGDCPPETDDDTCYVADNGKSGVNISVEDGGDICAVDKMTCEYVVLWFKTNNTQLIVDTGKFTDKKQIIFTEDSLHELFVSCKDALGNTVQDNETFLVDSTPPKTIKTYGLPFYTDNVSEWINSSTKITLAATDNKVGVNKTYWRNYRLVDPESSKQICGQPNKYCDPQYYSQFVDSKAPWTQYTGPFTKPNESCHIIEYYSTDLLNNKENMKWQCVYVDNTAPQLNKTVGDPKIPCDNTGLCNYYISMKTPVTLSCIDPLPHPSDHISLWYRYRLSDDCSSWGPWSNWTDPTGVSKKTIYFKEESCHELEYYCKDALGNMNGIQREIDIVDAKPPVITKQITGPMFGNCPPVNQSDICYIDNATKIEVDADDQQPHPVDKVTCDWRYSVRQKDITGGKSNVTVPFTIQFPEESIHDLTITCMDALGNTAKDTETFYVDHTPPATTKTYSGPIFEEDNMEWISSATMINLTVVDAGPHKSGVKETKYRVTLVDDVNCRQRETCELAQGAGNWNTYTKPFNISEDSCHLIEYYSVDNVNKTEKINKQCAFVDNLPPVTNKIVADPKAKWDGQDSTFYPEIKDLCWNGQGDEIECWKVTLLTPITLECADAEPHPVDHESLCYKVDFDGDDLTQKYCEEGQINEDGWCCGDPAGTTFYFTEESEHNMKYYCIDALGNTGPVDEEKFKVEGSSFNITLNKKWNLISVPLVMLNDSIDEVFKGVADDVESVWSYDSMTGDWYVYTPGPAPDTLGEMVPGEGYWVKAFNNTVLRIGGSLFSPATTPPSKEIVNGWNLVGYWGTEGLSSYNGPFGNGLDAYCELYSIGTSIFDKELASLWTYWEPDNPNQWIPFTQYERMDPGAGYWLYTAHNGLFVPPTDCGGY